MVNDKLSAKENTTHFELSQEFKNRCSTNQAWEKSLSADH